MNSHLKLENIKNLENNSKFFNVKDLFKFHRSNVNI